MNLVTAVMNLKITQSTTKGAITKTIKLKIPQLSSGMIKINTLRRTMALHFVAQTKRTLKRIKIKRTSLTPLLLFILKYNLSLPTYLTSLFFLPSLFLSSCLLFSNFYFYFNYFIYRIHKPIYNKSR
uniref:Transmembrane protein n=1 Tax=Cacopsylla melanoneura TaxID=428564 RepID=A0A8D8RWL7_9HEMI